MINFESLINQQIQAAHSGLVVVDENIDARQLKYPEGWHALTNRFDQMQQLLSQGWHCTLADFSWPAQLETDLVLFRISKEKAIVHHLINLVATKLKPNGRLILFGNKSEGIKSYSKSAQKRLGGERQERKIGGDSWVVELTLGAQQGNELDDQQYTRVRPVADISGQTLLSKPGVYGWKKVDKGSQQLIERLPTMLHTSLPLGAVRVLDLGCGSGYLALAACGKHSEITATDNNAAAVTATQATLSQAGLQASVLLSDAAEELDSKFDLILCNPPFHSGFGIDYDLTDRFTKNAARLLTAEGRACFVVNQHVPLKRIALNYFYSVELDLDSGNFCTYLLTKPRTF